MYVSTNPAGIVRISGLLVNVNAYNSSFHEFRKAKNPTATTPGMMIGITIDHNTPNRLKPSTRAASSRSVGSVSQKPLIIQILNGSENVVNASTSAGYVLSIPNCRNSVYSEIRIVTYGNICVARINRMRLRAPRNWKRESTYPAGVAANNVNSVVARLTIKLFLKYCTKPSCSSGKILYLKKVTFPAPPLPCSPKP